MRIAIDARAYSWTGIGRYTRNLIRCMLQDSTSHHFIILLSPSDIPIFKKEQGQPHHVTIMAVEADYYSWREQLIFWKQLEAIEADIFHFTHFNVPLFFSKPYVVTIHDTTRFIFSGQRRQDLLHQLAYEWIFKRAVEKARGVICVSSSTADELRQLPITLPARTRIIHEGVEDTFQKPISLQARQEVRNYIGSNNPYLLFVGVWMNHKNLERLLTAFKIILKTYPDLKLVITGRQQPGYVNVVALAQKQGVEASVIFPGFVPAELLPALYAEARLFVFPSLYEGFGLPPLEAIGCGTPVISSMVSSLPEILEKAAWYVNPDSVLDIAHGIDIVLSETTIRQRLKEAGYARLKAFQWETAATHTLQILTECGTV